MGLLGLWKDVQSQRLEQRVSLGRSQRCRRCGLTSDVLVEARGEAVARPAGLMLNANDLAEGQAEAASAASRNAWVSLQLARCVSCERRGVLANALAVVVTPHWVLGGATLGAVVGLVGAWPVQTSGLIGAALGLGYGAARRLGRADVAVRRA
jgi:hypothetical protein